MRVLRLTNSNDTNPNVPAESNKAMVGEHVLAQAVGLPVETVTRTIWPGPELPGLIDSWIAKYEPDLVFLLVSSYWFTYLSAPVRVERALGPLGKPIVRASRKLAGTPAIAYNAGFRGLRRATLKVVGGATFFTVDEVNATVEECLRRITRHEHLAVAVRGPRIPFAPEGSPRARRVAEERRRAVDRFCRDICFRLHIEYMGWETARTPQDDPAGLQGDLVHMDASLHVQQGELEGAVMARAWSQLHPPSL